jgi:predicted lipid carrier protein YhbT
MPQDSEPKPEGEAELAAAARQILDASNSEPIPPKLIQLAEELQAAIAKRPKCSEEPH